MSDTVRLRSTLPPVSPEEEQRLLGLIADGRAAKESLATAKEDDIPALKNAIQQGLKARDVLIETNQRLIISIAKRYRVPGVTLTMEELCQEGNIGLIKAIERWRPDKGAKKLSTYATWWIRQSVSRAVSDLNRTIRLPVHVGDRGWRISQAVQRLHRDTATDPTIEEIAAEAGETVEQVEQLMKWCQLPASLDAPAGKDSDSLPLFGSVPSDADTPYPAELLVVRGILEKALDELPVQDAAVLRMYYGLRPQGDLTLNEIGQRYGFSRGERVRQIREQALAQMRKNPRVRQMYGFLEG